MPLSSVLGAQSITKPGVCTSTTRPSSPFDGQVIYETDTDTLAVYDGAGWVSLNPVNRDRNLVINGAMQIHQRGASATSITTSGYRTVDRFSTGISALGTWTETVENDAPTGSGFRKSAKLLCTTADASPAAGDYIVYYQVIEGQNLQQIAKGTPLAKRLTFSFWVKGTTTGTYIVELYDNANTRAVSASYTINAANTWEKKIITFPADTTGEAPNTNAAAVSVQWWLGAGTTFTSGTLATTWASATSANRAVGQTNLAAATNNYWQVTGVQLEAGSVATPFEFEEYGTTLTKCQRYYEKSYATETAPGTATSANMPMVTPGHAGASTAGAMDGYAFFKTTKRAGATVTLYDASGNVGKCRRTAIGVANYENQGTQDISVDTIGFYFRSGSGSTSNTMSVHFVASAEL